MKHVIEESDASVLMKEVAETLGIKLNEEKQILNCIWYT